MQILDRKVITVKEYAKLTEDREVLKSQYGGREKAANARVNALKDTIETIKKNHSAEVEKLKDRYTRDFKLYLSSKEQLTEELTVLRKRKSEYLGTVEKSISIESRERVLKAKEAAFADVEKQLANTVKRIDDAREEGMKKGYADGIADGLREASKITAEDRKMMAQIAALAASSHTPEAANKIAESVLNEVNKNALPATTDKR